jgi:hypothetical protein
LARESGRKVDSLLVLSASNDPFYAGAPAGREQGEWFAALWKQLAATAGIHVRRIHYRLVSLEPPPALLDGTPYLITERCYDKLQCGSCFARHLALVPAHHFVDRRNPEPILHAAYHGPPPETGWRIDDPPSWFLPRIDHLLTHRIVLRMPAPEAVGYEYWQQDQPFHLELWIEKSTMNDVLVPLCRKLGVNLVTSVGMQSISSAVRLLERLDHLRRITGTGKPARLFYASDFDPAGVAMPVGVARQVEFYRSRYAPEADLKLTPLILTKEQVIAYRLPRIPIKDEDVRKGNFEDRHGEGAVELDALEALHPGEFERIIREAIEPYRDPSLAEAFEEAQEEAQQAVDEAWEEATEPIREELQEIEAEAAKICGRYEEKLRALNNKLQKELAPLKQRLEESRHALDEKTSSLEIDLPGRPDPEVDVPDEGDWLFDSGREYLEQLEVYKAFQGKSNDLVSLASTCCICGRVFVPCRSGVQCCSRRCREKAYRQKKAGLAK